MAQFTDHVVWITGGGSGIGRALAVAFAAEGATVAVSGRRVDRLDEVVSAIHDAGGRAFAVACDVTDEAQVAAAVASVIEQGWKLDVAVANAGFSVAGRIETLSADDWRRQLDVNVVGAALTAKYALPELRKTRGRLALVGSVASMVTAPKAGAYAASKYAVRAIGQTLAMELDGSGVSVTTLHPGFVESEIAQVDNNGVYHEDRGDPRPSNLMWPADEAARAMLRAIARRKREFVFTGHGRFAAFVGRHTPGLVHAAVTSSARRARARKSDA